MNKNDDHQPSKKNHASNNNHFINQQQTSWHQHKTNHPSFTPTDWHHQHDIIDISISNSYSNRSTSINYFTNQHKPAINHWIANSKTIIINKTQKRTDKHKSIRFSQAKTVDLEFDETTPPINPGVDYAFFFGNAPGLWSQKAATLCALRAAAAAAAGHILPSGLYNSSPSDPSPPPRLLPLVLQDGHPQVQQIHNRPNCDRTNDSWRVFSICS